MPISDLKSIQNPRGQRKYCIWRVKRRFRFTAIKILNVNDRRARGKRGNIQYLQLFFFCPVHRRNLILNSHFLLFATRTKRNHQKAPTTNHHHSSVQSPPVLLFKRSLCLLFMVPSSFCTKNWFLATFPPSLPVDHWLCGCCWRHPRDFRSEEAMNQLKSYVVHKM